MLSVVVASVATTRRALVTGGAAALCTTTPAVADTASFFLAPPNRDGIQVCASAVMARCRSARQLRGGWYASAWLHGLVARLVPARQAKWLEQVRIFLQDEADAVQYGGQEGLAPGGPPPAVPALRLLPIVQMQQTLRTLPPMVADQARWETLYDVVSTGQFETKEFKRIFNAYSDNIYYTSNTAEANAYLLGGATPSTSQTTQYLLRNEALKQLAELRDEIRYQQGLPAAKRETEVADEALQAVLKCFDEYLSLSPANEVKFARDAVYGEGRS
jgi:hypothetical protein